MSDAAANARAFSGPGSNASEKDQPMIESGAGTVYEAIVRRKSRAAIWRAAAPDRAWPGAQAEISAWAPGKFRNLGQPVERLIPQKKQIPCKSMH
ncbi:hypothetical protein [Burkholderia sp. BCC0322]|uniref:hypothetical protein n=1 Tax=unclassified Burkholderia TaxID=2613784 RepID=UPI00158C5192|nr:hypothetical protein [Burkholderia sp. BCC0322]